MSYSFLISLGRNSSTILTSCGKSLVPDFKGKDVSLSPLGMIFVVS